MIFIKFHLNWSADFGEFFLIFGVLLLFCYFLPLENTVVPDTKRCDFPSSTDELCQPWLQSAQQFWRSKKKIKLW
jgi:hypothetical protein